MKNADNMSTEEWVEFWAMALGELKSSGLSKAEFGRQNGVKPSTLIYWQRGLDRMKALVFEVDGVVLMTKCLSKGRFQWPRDQADVLEHEG